MMTPTLTIRVSKKDRKFWRELAKRRGFKNLSAYLRSLVERDARGEPTHEQPELEAPAKQLELA